MPASRWAARLWAANQWVANSPPPYLRCELARQRLRLELDVIARVELALDNSWPPSHSREQIAEVIESDLARRVMVSSSPLTLPFCKALIRSEDTIARSASAFGRPPLQVSGGLRRPMLNPGRPHSRLVDEPLHRQPNCRDHKGTRCACTRFSNMPEGHMPIRRRDGIMIAYLGKRSQKLRDWSRPLRGAGS